jgi:hypothetical protein
MKGRACTVCVDAKLSRSVSQMLAEGLSQSEIARRLKIGKMSLSRHVRAHLLPVTKAIARAVERDNPAREQRQQLIEAAEKGDLNPEQYLSLGAVVGDLRRAADRIERTSGKAEEAGQMNAVAALSSQAIRAVETRARLGSVGGFASQKGRSDGEASVPFSITFHLGDRTEKLELTPVNAPHTIDHVPTDAAPPHAVKFDFQPDPLWQAGARLPALLSEDDEDSEADAEE